MMVVLLVDDEPLIRFGVEALLDELGHRTLSAANGTQALQNLSNHPEIEFLLTDFRMPGLSGLELVDQCRSLRPDLKIILMTGYSSMDHNFSEDCPIRLEKPFSMDDLQNAIDSFN